MKKFLFIFIPTLLIVSVLAVPCFATNEGTYGHYISPGTYVFDEVISRPSVYSSFTLDFEFLSNSQLFNGINAIYVGYAGGDMLYMVTGSESISVYTTDFGWSDDSYRTISFDRGFYIYDSVEFTWFLKNLTRIDAGYNSSILDEFLSAFTFVGQWISGAASDLTAIFWTGSELTFVGILSVSALSFAVSFMMIGLISRFLRFRG